MNPPIAPNMPDQIRSVFRTFHGEHAGLRRKVRTCRDLWTDRKTDCHFGTNRTWVFSDVRWALFDDMHLIIARLTDPAMTGKKENLVLERLIEMVVVDLPQNTSLAGELRAHLDAARVQAKEIREMRNTMIAHNDLQIFTNEQLVFLRTGLDKFDTITGEFDDILNTIQVVYGGHQIPVDFLEIGHDASRLVESLRRCEELVSRAFNTSERM